MVNTRRRKRARQSNRRPPPAEAHQAEHLSDHSTTDDEVEIVSVHRRPSFTSAPASQTWADRFSTSTQRPGLIVSTRKANELRNWLSAALRSTGPRFLVLAGPPGCGKTSAIRSIATELSCSVVTWRAPAVSAGGGVSETLLRDLHAFVTGTRYSAFTPEGHSAVRSRLKDALTPPRRILVVDDLPVAPGDLQRFRDALGEILRRAAQFAPHPTVIVLSDSAKGIARTVRLVLGLDFVESRIVASVNVPAVTEVMMRKRLKEVLTTMRVNVLPGVIDEVVLACGGDFRAALNCLQFSAAVGVVPTIGDTKTVGKRPRNSTQKPTVESVANVGTDGTLGTYHAVSKILNNKREEDGASKYVAENVMEEAKVEPVIFLEFLHHNYPLFFGDADDIVTALDYLSDADLLLPWRMEDDYRHLLQQCAASVATRAFLCFNSAPLRSGWRPIRGPESFEVGREGRDHAALARRFLVKVTLPAVSGRSEVCETLPLVEAMWKRSVKPWGKGVAQMTGQSCVADAADIAMVEAESGVWNNRNGDNDNIPTWNMFLTNDGGPQAEVEDIEEWDDN